MEDLELRIDALAAICLLLVIRSERSSYASQSFVEVLEEDLPKVLEKRPQLKDSDYEKFLRSFIDTLRVTLK